MRLGSEIWMADLSFFQTVRQATKRDGPGADTICDDLKVRFPGVAGDLEEPEPLPTPQREPVVSLRSTDRLMASKPSAWDEGAEQLLSRC